MNLIDLENNFFGREPVLSLLDRRVTGLKEGYRQNVALLGPRYVGKTAILRKFLSDLDDEGLIGVYLDLEDRDLGCVVSQWTRGILYQYLKARDSVIPEDIMLLCAACRSEIPQTVEAVLKVHALLAEQKFKEVYQGLLTLPDIFHAESRKSCVLVLDEFHAMEDLGIPEVFQELGRRVMTQRNCLYIVASSYEEVAKTILSEKLSLLFGNFEVVSVDTFDLVSSQKLVEHNLDGIRLGLNLKNFLADFTGGQPLYLNLISQELIYMSGVYHQEEIYGPLVVQAVENLLFNPWGVISRHFELRMSALCQGKGGCFSASLLMSLASGKHRAQDLADALKVKPAQIAARLNVLLAEGVVDKNGNYHHIRDILFKYWIRFVHERRMKAVEIEPGRGRKLFKEEMTRALNEFQNVARQDLSSRMTGLLNRFDNEAFILNGRRYKLSAFTRVAPIKFREGADEVEGITATGEEGEWVVVLKKDLVLENDVAGIVEELKRFSQRPSRCVIVSLSGLDENAKIKALQERMWVWDESDVNALMHLYDEPNIVR